MPSNLRIDPERLWSTLMDTAAIGAASKGGINRQTLTAEDGQVRAWFKREAEALGCKVSVDEVGNMFALRPGRQAGLAPIALPEDALAAVKKAVAGRNELTVDVETLELTHPDGLRVSFALDPYDRETLVHGLDDIARTMKREDAITAYEGVTPPRFDTRALA